MQKNSFPIAIKYAAYAGLMFFSFLVEKKLKTDYQDFSQQERDFISHRCKIGSFSLMVAVVAMGMFALGAWSGFWFLFVFAKMFVLLLLFVQVAGMLMITADLSLTASKIDLSPPQKRQLVQLFLPWKTEKSWFQQADFSKPNRRLKESQLWRWGISFCYLCFPVAELGTLLLLLLVIRIVFLLSGQDWIPPQIKSALNLSYLKYVEELCFIPYLLLKKLQKRESGMDFQQLQVLQMRSQTSNFFGSWKRILSFGAVLLLFAILGWRMGMWRKLIPLGWRILRRIFLKK